MKTLLTAFFVLMTILPASAAVLSFQDWKQQREHEALTALEKARQDDKQASSGRNRKKQDPSGLSESGGRFHRVSEKDSVSQAEQNLKVARDLSVNDYFVLYLRLQPDGTFREGVEKMSKAELGELMLSFKNQINTVETAPAALPLSTDIKPSAPTNNAL